MYFTTVAVYFHQIGSGFKNTEIRTFNDSSLHVVIFWDKNDNFMPKSVFKVRSFMLDFSFTDTVVNMNDTRDTAVSLNPKPLRALLTTKRSPKVIWKH